MNWFVIIWIAVSVVIVLYALIKLLNRPTNLPTQGRGVKPGQGYSVVEGGIGSSGTSTGGGVSRTVLVHRDPQKYAKAFVPSNVKKR